MLKINKEIHTIKLSIGENCFLRCSYCYVDNQYSSREYQDDEWVDISIAFWLIDLLIESPWKKKFLQLIWGEPLMYESILQEVILYARKKEIEYEKNVIIFFVTNGLLFNNQNLLFYKNNKVKIWISIDWQKFYHNKHRFDKNNNGTYDKVVEKIYLVKEYLPTEDIGISMTVHPDDVHALSANFIFLAKKFNCTILTSIASGMEWNQELFSEWLKEFKKVYSFIIYSINKGEYYYLNGLNYLLRDSILQPYRYRQCLWSALECFKNWDVAFYASASKNYNTPYFNINDSSKYSKEKYLNCVYEENSVQCKKCIVSYKVQEDDTDISQVWYMLREKRFEWFSNYIIKKAEKDNRFLQYIEKSFKNMYFNDSKNEFYRQSDWE